MDSTPFPARMGLACHKCGKEMDVQLSRCGGCRRIAYCSLECQKADWKAHKHMCKALSSLEKNSLVAWTAVSLLPEEPMTDVAKLRELIEQQMAIFLSVLQRSSPLAIEQHSWFECEPRCMVCTRTDMIMRMEAVTNGTTLDDTTRLIPCTECKTSFCCSPAHWEAAHELHRGPSDDLRDGLSQCHMNKLVRAQIMFETSIPSIFGRDRQLLWISKRVKPVWASLKNSTWNSELEDEIRKSFRIPAPSPATFLITAASDILSMAMTILYGLEQLNDDDGWTRKHTLTVHILGATFRESSCLCVFEEIMHRLPKVKSLKLVLCGPDVQEHVSGSREICADCTALDRSYVVQYATESVLPASIDPLIFIYIHFASTYHDFVQKQGSKFENPNLCVGFQSGASSMPQYPWPTTFKLLVKRKIPSLFTGYCREEAEGDATMLRATGATLHPALGPALNPWGSMNALPTPYSTYGFHVNEGWLAGGFRHL
ncbi:hypothetical protein B0H11DRAFT_1862310 [Mycena galericulata]|nr:hypothetical protein B0H11DRAFT_1862310 [Mycena galericulata]